MIIESSQNDKVKYLNRLLTDNRFRKKENVFTVEGQQENERALKYSYEPVDYFICESIYDGKFQSNFQNISPKIYEKLAYRGSSEGIIGIYKVPENRLKDFKPKETASVIVLEGIEKPGNLGAILRSCEAFGIDALIVTDLKADFYNPNVIRSSVGCLFGMNIYQAENPETLNFLQLNQFKIFTTNMHHDAQDLYLKDFNSKSALLFGTEHSGLSEFWDGQGENIIIPMAGSIDSLNISNAVAISCYEILRQKKSH